ncbi:MAG: hypothetical protein ACHQE6_00395 [Solirubrobacterales bacterium]
MSDEKTAILIRALEASGSEREAQLARAILGDPAAAAAADPAAPVAPASAAPVAPLVPAPQGPQPPPGKAPVQSLEEFEALPQAERLARMDEADALLLSGAE